MPRYKNTGTKPVHTGDGGFCYPGEFWTSKISVNNPNLTEIKPKKKVAKK